MKNSIILAVILLFASSSFATLVQVYNNVYRTNEGEDAMYWYLNKNDATNMKWTSQNIFTLSLQAQKYSNLRNWHIADIQEIQQLFTFEPDLGPYNSEIASILDLSTSDDFYFRYDYVSSNPPLQGNHWIVKLDYRAGKGWVATTGCSYVDDDKAENLGVVIVRTPEPSTLFLFGLGAWCLRRRRYN